MPARLPLPTPGIKDTTARQQQHLAPGRAGRDGGGSGPPHWDKEAAGLGAGGREREGSTAGRRDGRRDDGGREHGHGVPSAPSVHPAQ